MAFIGPQGEETTFGELGAQVNRISHGLRALGVGKEDMVAILVHNGREYIELALATIQLGAYIVPINTHLAPPELAYIVKDSTAKVLVAHSDLAGHLHSEIGGLLGAPLRHRRRGRGLAALPRAVERLARGTTRRPGHGRHHELHLGHHRPPQGRAPSRCQASAPNRKPRSPRSTSTRSASGSRASTSSARRCTTPPPGAFAINALHLGHTVVCHLKFDAEAVLRAIERYKVTTSHMVPTHFHRMLRLPEEVRLRYDVSSLDSLIHAAAPCPVEVKKQMMEWVGPKLYEYLAATEGGMSQVTPEEWLAKPGTVG
ncbi:AMP-binding protein [Nonomuraea ferruginea]